jgi:hypothetical protein
VRPPAPPPPNPAPIVVAAGGVAAPRKEPSHRVEPAVALIAHRTGVVPLLDSDVHPWPPLRSGGGLVSIGVGWVSIDAFLGLYLGDLVERSSARVAEEPIGDELGRGNVLDGQADGLEDRDRVDGPRGDPVRADAPDLYQVVFRH